MPRQLKHRCLKTTLLLDMLLLIPQLLLVMLVTFVVAQFSLLWALVPLMLGYAGVKLDFGLLKRTIINAAEKRDVTPNLLFRIDVEREQEIVGAIRWHRLYGKYRAEAKAKQTGNLSDGELVD